MRSSSELTLQEDRAELERLLLRFAVGAATERLYVSFPRIETAEARARVPSFYALEIMRAVTGRVPDHQTLELEGCGRSQREPGVAGASSAPKTPSMTSSTTSSVLRASHAQRRAMSKVTRITCSGLNDCLRRSVTERWARAQKPVGRHTTGSSG